MGKVEYNFSNGLRYFPVIKEDINNESSPTFRFGIYLYESE